jgi:hypothetical protein
MTVTEPGATNPTRGYIAHTVSFDSRRAIGPPTNDEKKKSLFFLLSLAALLRVVASLQRAAICFKSSHRFYLLASSLI